MADGQPKRYTVVDAQGAVRNIIVWDGVTPFNPGPGLTVRPYADGDVMPSAEHEES